MSDTWMPVPGFDDYYEVSDTGAVRRIKTRDGKPCCILRAPGSRRGYLSYTVSKNAERVTLSAHRLVWEAFNGPIPEGMQINHKNGRKADNRLSNLEVCTPSENMSHAYTKLGRDVRRPQKGEKNGRAKLCEADLPEVRRLRAEGWSQQKIADRFGVDQTAISAFLCGKTWRSAA